MMAGPVQDSEFNFVCQQCPRTFKLQEFYEKHQKVHLLKKQHVCRVCGYVYGAAKGLEGHMEAAHGGEVASPSPQPAHFNNNNNSSKNNNTKSIEEVAQNLTNKPPTVRPKLSPSVPMDLSQAMPEMPFLHFLQAQGVLSSSDLLKQAQTAMLAQMSQAASNTRNLNQALSLHPITISAPTSPNQASPNSVLQQKPNDKSKIPSPAGTGNYKIYDEVPEIQDASDAAQNESGFFSCTICSREFSGLNSLKKHVPIHTRRVQHKCDTCGYVFGKKEYLLDHMRKHTGEISPVCEVCGQTFNKSLKLKEHLKLHRNTTHDGNLNDAVPYRCHICKQCFATPEPLGDHLRSAHSETVYKCDMCDATFGDVRGKNHHMYNEHQLDAFHQKCVWCPVCNQGFTRHYNLKVHMYKSHGKEYLENNFSAEELDAIMRPPPGSNTSKPSPTPRKRSDEEIVIPGTPTGVLPISPPLTPKLSPNNKKARSEDSPTMVPSNSVIPSANILKAKQNGKAGVAKPQHYFDQDAQHSMLQCQVCEEKFLRKTDLYIHLAGHGVRVIGCQLCDDKFLDVEDLKAHLAADHGHDSGDSDGEGAAGDSVSPPGTRGARPASSNLPSHLSGALGGGDSAGFPCHQCGKVLMHKQSYVSHMRVIHGDYYGGNKWQGSSVVEMVLGGHTNGAKRPLDGKQGNACEFCNKSFTDQHHLDNHIATKHPNLSKRIMAFKAALGLNDSDQPDSKRIKLDTKEVHKRETDQLTNNNNVKSDIDIDTIHEDEEDRMEEESHNKTEEMHEEEESEPKDSEEEEVYEHRGKVFKRVLNFSPEESKSKKESEVGSEDDEEGQMVIDEARSPSSSPENLILSHRRSPPSPITKNNFNNNELKINNFGQGFANAINICRKEAEESQPQPTHTVKFEPLHHALYYPAAFPDFSLPFSLSGLIQKKRSEMAAILAPRLSPKSPREQHSPAKLTLDHLAKAAMVSKSSSLSPAKSDSGSSSNTAVSEYENQIQNDLWPIDCIKCNSTLTSLDNFNIHMNDHWSDDKCCPVCGLLINSKRFNFKQHLKIHTGEKPFVCQVCNRAFRQKAHMVKHVTTHRSEPRSMSDNLYGVKPGVIVQ